MALPDDDRPDDMSPLPDDLVVPDDLSALLDGDTGTEALPSQEGSISVVAAIDPLQAAPYITTVQPDDDVAISLPYDKAVAYGMAVLAAAHRAHYLAAVLGQARDIMKGRRSRPALPDVDGNARFLLGQLIDDLPDLDDTATAPLRFRPFVRSGDSRPMVRVSLPPHTQAITGWTFAETLDHAHAVLGQAIVSQLDTAYRTLIAVNFGVGEQRGRAAVTDLSNYYWDKPVIFSDPTDQPPDPRRARPTGKGKRRKR